MELHVSYLGCTLLPRVLQCRVFTDGPRSPTTTPRPGGNRPVQTYRWSGVLRVSFARFLHRDLWVVPSTPEGVNPFLCRQKREGERVDCPSSSPIHSRSVQGRRWCSTILVLVLHSDSTPTSPLPHPLHETEYIL